MNGDLRSRLAAGAETRQGSVELVLRRHGVSAQGLSGLARRAVLDFYESAGGSLSGAKLEDAIGFVRERGIRALLEYDPVKARGLSPTTFAYRIMRLRVTDWLRADLGDRRFGNDGRVSLSSDGEMRFVEREEDTVDDAVERLAGGLSERSAWTLRHVASAVAQGSTLVEVVEVLMADLADEMGAALPVRLRELVRMPVDADFFACWAVAA